MEGTFVAEDIHLPHVYVDRVIKGHSYEKRIEVREVLKLCVLEIQVVVFVAASVVLFGDEGRGRGEDRGPVRGSGEERGSFEELLWSLKMACMVSNTTSL